MPLHREARKRGDIRVDPVGGLISFPCAVLTSTILTAENLDESKPLPVRPTMMSLLSKVFSYLKDSRLTCKRFGVCLAVIA